MTGVSADTLELVNELVALHRPGHALDQRFYTDPGIYELELERIVYRNWILAGHTSEFPDRGDYRRFDVARESAIVIRGDAGDLHAYANVCRHRGSRICVDARGKWRLVRLDIEGNKFAHDTYIFPRAKRNRGAIGSITSAAWSPVCKQNIALGTVRTPYGKPGSTLWVEIFYRRETHWNRTMVEAKVVDGPFWAPERRRQTPPAKY